VIRAFIETSLIDWDGKITSVLFFDRCNFRCPFCQNWRLITNPEKYPVYEFEEIFKRLIQKKNWIDGVVLTGGEPLLFYKDVIKISKKLKEHDFGVKLDTNGAFPDELESLLNLKLIDYIAMDIKAPLDDNYFIAIGRIHRQEPTILERIKKTISLLMNSGIEYEFRTTCVPGLIDKESIIKIGTEIKDAKRWVLQRFIPINAYKREFRKRSYDEKFLNELLDTAQNFVPNAKLR
jgi:pyruvate formate lyase activating enzyme